MDTQMYNAVAPEGWQPVAAGYKTDKGRKRSGNEDSYAVFAGDDLGGKLDGLFVVADGMGGTRGGEIASNLVINSLPEEVRIRATELSGSDLPHELANLLNSGIQVANSEVWRYKQQREGLQGMGTTCVAAMIAHTHKPGGRGQGFLVLANVGDSRAYLLRQGRLSQMTEDHSTVWEQVKAGKMTPEQAANSRFRNEITRAIGLRPEVMPDITIRALEAGDVILLCSDGLTVEVDDQTIARLLASSPDPQIACDRLVETALANGGSDNITVVALHYGAFTPLADGLPTRESPDERTVWQGEDDDVTDPNQAWKRSLGSGREAQRELRPSQRESSPSREDRFVSSARGNYGVDVAVPRRGVSSLLFGLILLMALAEGAGLYLFWTGKLQPRIVAPKPPPIVIEPTSKPLVYQKPVLLYGRAPLWEGVLRVMPDGRILVVTMEGKLLAISASGSNAGSLNLLGSTAATPIPYAQPVKRVDGSLKTVPVPPAVAIDASGNHYELNPTTRAIDKYDASGVMLTHNIGQGVLHAPANLDVDKAGNLYVIDNRALKKIVAVPDTGQAQAASNAMPSEPAQTPVQHPAPAPSKSPTIEPTRE